MSPERGAALAAGLLGATLTDARPLGGSARSTVLRCRVVPPAPRLPGTVVVKAYGDGAAALEAFHREAVGLAELPRAPRLLAADTGHRVLVMTDLGEGPTLADLLLGTDRTAAWQGAVDWAAAVGDVVGAGRTAAGRVAAALAGRGVAPWDLNGAVADGAHRLQQLLIPGGSGQPGSPGRDAAGLPDDLALVGTLRTGDGAGRPAATDVVSPGDTCPDNAVLTAQGWRLLDLEGTTVHHVALDAAYTVLPFATCWCVFDPPPGLTDALLDGFTAGLARHLPRVVDAPGWSRSVDLACGAWVLAMTGWLLDGALEGRPQVGPPGVASPSYRQLLAGRWRWGAVHLCATLPAVAGLLDAAAAWADEHWGADAASPGRYPALA